ncbi:MAG: response regulator [Myxococcota bacterium]
MKRLLLVEDDEDIRHIASLVLKRRFDVAEAPDGQSALRLGLVFKPEIVLMDLMMPGLDGVETLRRMRRTVWGEHVVAILMTARSITYEPELASQGFASVIPKPFDPLSLDQRVLGALP